MSAAPSQKPINSRYARLLERLDEGLASLKCGQIATGKHEIERALKELRVLVEQATPR
jgi:hypothetical protein